MFIWTNVAILDETITLDWEAETRNAIKQLANDLYINPLNSGDGVGKLAFPIEKGIPFKDGIISCNSKTGVAVSFPVGITFADIDQYGISADFQEDTDGSGGDIYFTKALDQVTIHNSGSMTGKKIYYRIFRVAS